MVCNVTQCVCIPIYYAHTYACLGLACNVNNAVAHVGRRLVPSARAAASKSPCVPWVLLLHTLCAEALCAFIIMYVYMYIYKYRLNK